MAAPMSKRKKQAIWDKSEGVCWYCGENLMPELWTVDHVVPRKKGGRGVMENLVPACKSCNSQKGDGELDRLREIVTAKHHEWPQFSASQLRWLREHHGFDPYPDRVEFWFEKKGMTP